MGQLAVLQGHAVCMGCLLQRDREECWDRIRLQLCVDDFEQLKEKLTSIPPREWIGELVMLLKINNWRILFLL